MSTLREVTEHLKVDRIFDVALVQGMVAVAAGGQGLVLINPENGVRVDYTVNLPLDGPILVSHDRIFFNTYTAQPDPHA
ncbi:MAG: hypothetical protein KJ645_09270, partial [Planctomycetes bacterium]|nr:hypothetical protein [Planctomycetota bacterium]